MRAVGQIVHITKKGASVMDRNQLSDFNTNSQTGDKQNRPGKDIWGTVLNRLQKTVSQTDFNRWISDLRLIAEVDGNIVIAARDKLSFDRVTAEHKRQIQRYWREADAQRRSVRIVCWRQADDDLLDLIDDPWAAETVTDTSASETTANSAPSANNGERLLTFDTLVTGPSNRKAAELAHRIANGLQVGTSNVLLYGLPGVGKTHILRALKNEAEHVNPDRNVVYMTAEEFLSCYTEGAKARDTSALKKRLQSADVLLIDDLHRIAGKKGTETELYQNIREVSVQGGLVVMAGDQAPGDITGFSPRMRSELTGAVAAEVGAPDSEMRRKIITDLADHILQTNPSFVITEEMVTRINSDIRGPGRELVGVVWSLFTEADFGKDAPTMEMLERILRRVNGETRAPTIEQIKRATMKIYNVSKTDLESPSKAQAVVYPRHIAMYLCRKLTGKSYPQIGRSFGNRDHTTVLYSNRKITKAMKDHPDIASDVSRVTQAIYELQAATRN